MRQWRLRIEKLKGREVVMQGGKCNGNEESGSLGEKTGIAAVRKKLSEAKESRI